MKKILIFILFPFISFSQKDSVKVSFSEEIVEKFEKTEIINISERYYKRKVNSALKLGFFTSPFIANNNVSILFVGYEQKIGKEFSLNMALNFENLSMSLVYEVEPRWYFGMKKRVNNGLQAYNTSGKYLSFKYKNPQLKNENRPILENVPYLENSAYSFNIGQQFGNSLDLFLSAGYKNTRESFVNNKGDLQNNNFSQQSNTWFIGSNFRLNAGLNFPRIFIENQEKFKNLTFSHNNYDIKHLQKINLKDIFYVDKYSQYLKIDYAYENRLGNSMFSTNTMFVGLINHFVGFNQIGKRDSTVKNTEKGTSFTFKIPVWENAKNNNIYTSFQLTEQLRYYLSKKKEMKKGKSGKNFNGVYVGLEASYFQNSVKNEYGNLKDSKTFGLGGVIGLQNQFSNKIFFDYGLSGLVRTQKPTDNTFIMFSSNFFITSYLKIGLVK